jgi:hypothetical protein
MAEHWFARRFPVGHPRSALAPVSREGWLVTLGFVVAMVLGGAAYVALDLAGYTVLAIVVFAAVAAAAGFAFIATAQRKGDHSRTVADYRGKKAGAPT